MIYRMEKLTIRVLFLISSQSKFKHEDSKANLDTMNLNGYISHFTLSYINYTWEYPFLNRLVNSDYQMREIIVKWYTNWVGYKIIQEMSNQLIIHVFRCFLYNVLCETWFTYQRFLNVILEMLIYCLVLAIVIK
jgi:hypothetical protein